MAELLAVALAVALTVAVGDILACALYVALLDGEAVVVPLLLSVGVEVVV